MNRLSFLTTILVMIFTPSITQEPLKVTLANILFNWISDDAWKLGINLTNNTDRRLTSEALFNNPKDPYIVSTDNGTFDAYLGECRWQNINIAIAPTNKSRRLLTTKMQILCLLMLVAVCVGYVSAQWGMGMPYYGPVGPFGGTPYARLRAMSAYGMMPYRGFGFG